MCFVFVYQQVRGLYNSHNSLDKKKSFAPTISLSLLSLTPYNTFSLSNYRRENLFLKALIVLAIMGATFLPCGLSLDV